MSLVVQDLPADLRAEAGEALAVLQDKNTGASAYRQAMRRLGGLLAGAVARDTVLRGARVCLAMTVEDADFLGAGALEVFERAGADVSVACFWNDRANAFGVEWADMAPITQEYVESLDHIEHLVVLKSIISGSCVVRSNLEHLFDKFEPAHVHVAAPVMLDGADERLERDFSKRLSDRFRYWTFEIDTRKDAEGNVYPGVGGEVYERLGIGDKVSKNAIVPDLIRRRATAA